MRPIAAILLLLLLAPVSAPAPRLLILGDSLARGAYASNPAATYAARLSTAIGSTERTTVRGDVRRLESAEAGWQAEAAKGWDIVILQIATNDVLFPTITDADEWTRRYAALTTAISASGARLICATPFDVGTQQAAMAARAELIRQSCTGGEIADLWTATKGRPELRAVPGSPTWYNHNDGVANDSLHPNDDGHWEIYRTLRDIIIKRVYLPMVAIPQSHPKSKHKYDQIRPLTTRKFSFAMP